MFKTAEIKEKDGIKTVVCERFGGLDERVGAKNFAICDMADVTGEQFPVIASRKKRAYLYRHGDGKPKLDIKGMAYHDGLIYFVRKFTEGLTLTYELYTMDMDGETEDCGMELDDTIDSERKLIVFGKYLLIFPDAMYYKLDGTDDMGSLNVVQNVGEVTFRNGSVYGEAAMANTIYCAGGFDENIRVGDAVKISGCVEHEYNNKTAIVRGISDGRTELYFSERCFQLHDCHTFTANDYHLYHYFDSFSDGEWTFHPLFPYSDFNFHEGDVAVFNGTKVYAMVNGVRHDVEFELQRNRPITAEYIQMDATWEYKETNVTVSRVVPEMDFVCVNENRLFGCAGDTIFVSKLGDPFNFEVFDGVSTDSFTVETGTQGSFTGCTTFSGVPTFFKHDRIFKLYGSTPQNYQIVQNDQPGVRAGAADSIQAVGGVLIYVSPIGVVSYNGSTVRNISEALNDAGREFEAKKAETDGRRYYAFCDGNVYVYDVMTGLWHVERTTFVLHCRSDDYRVFAYNGEDFGDLLQIGDVAQGVEDVDYEDEVRSFVTFAPYTGDEPCKKQLDKIIVRAKFLDADEGDFLQVSAYDEYDNKIASRMIGYLGDEEARDYISTYVIPVTPSRSDNFQIYISGCGALIIYSVAYRYSVGSELLEH